MEPEIDRLRKKVENFPSPSSYNRLAELLHLAKVEDEAEAVCRKCIKEFPRNSQVFVLLADIQLGRGNRAEAEQQLRAAIERDGRNYAANRMLADMLAENRDIPGAVAQLRQVLALRPGDPGATRRLGELEAQLKGVPAGARLAQLPAAAKPIVAASSGARPAASAPLQMPISGSGSGSRTAPAVGAGSAVRTTPGSGVRRSAIDTLAAEPGVKGAVVVNPQGQVVMTRGIEGGRDEVLAAFSSALAIAVGELSKVAGHPTPDSWLLGAEQGQVLAFHRDNGFSVVSLADSNVRPAMLELRARQALIDLGAT